MQSGNFITEAKLSRMYTSTMNSDQTAAPGEQSGLGRYCLQFAMYTSAKESRQLLSLIARNRLGLILM